MEFKQTQKVMQIKKKKLQSTASVLARQLSLHYPSYESTNTLRTTPAIVIKAIIGELERLVPRPVDDVVVGVVTAGVVSVVLLPSVEGGVVAPLAAGVVVVDPDPTVTESFMPIPQCPTMPQMK